MRRNLSLALVTLATASLLTSSALPTLGVDLESFEFNDPNFTELNDVANAANPLNQWSIEQFTGGGPKLVDSFVSSGVFDIRKFSNTFAPSYLDIADVASGKQYIVAEMSGWDIRAADAINNPEQIRFGFIDENVDGTLVTTGNAVTAQMQITSRDLGAGPVVRLEGSALGTGSTSLSQAVTLNTVQTAPFVMVLELDKTNNRYEVFYKDGTNPSQSLAQGFVSPGRDGNSIRFVANYNFGSSSFDQGGIPVADPGEFFSIDRVALTDTNPLSDLLTVEVDRDSGQVKLINSSGAALSGLESYSITSGLGALDSTGWKPITDNYDENLVGPGDGSVDMDDNWMIDSTTTSLLSESVIAGNGGDLSIGQEVILSTGGGPWIKNPNEDIDVELTFAGGVTRRPSVHFVGNGGVPFEVADLNFDGSITADDWTLFIAGAEADLSALSPAQAYQMGDLNFGGVNGVADFAIFKAAFEAANPLQSFEAMIAGVPEPGTCVLLAIGCLGLASPRRQRTARFQ